MEEVLRDLAAHNIQNRTIGFIENGSWAATAGKLMKEIFANCKNLKFLEKTVSIKSSLKQSQYNDIDEFINEISTDFATTTKNNTQSLNASSKIENSAFFKISYGLYLLNAKDGEKDNACIINTAQQITDNPKRITVSVNKETFTHDLVLKTKKFNLSMLTENTPFSIFQHFGFNCGRNINKFANTEGFSRSGNNLLYMTNYANAYISATVEQAIDLGSHTMFIAKVDAMEVLSKAPSATYAYYHANIKPKAEPKTEQSANKGKVAWRCKICGYIYVGEELPADFTCPLCKHPASDFEKIIL